MCLAQGPQSSDAGEALTRGPSVASQALCNCAACLAKAKNLVLKKYTRVGKSSFNLNCEANGAFGDRAEEGIYVVMFAPLSIFTVIPVTIYSTIELSDGVIVLGQPLKI